MAGGPVIECANDKDVFEIRHAVNKEAAENVIMTIIERLPGPRVYVCDLTTTPDSNQARLWEEGFAALTAQLREKGVGFIDPETIRALADFHGQLRISLSKDDPLFNRILRSGYLDEVYIPDDDLRNPRYGRLRKAAATRQVQVHTWHPKVECIQVPATRSTSI